MSITIKITKCTTHTLVHSTIALILIKNKIIINFSQCRRQHITTIFITEGEDWKTVKMIVGKDIPVGWQRIPMTAIGSQFPLVFLIDDTGAARELEYYYLFKKSTNEFAQNATIEYFIENGLRLIEGEEPRKETTKNYIFFPHQCRTEKPLDNTGSLKPQNI